jgi:hypothetical protein
MVFLFIQKPLHLSSFPGPTDAKCGVQSIKPLLQRPDCPDPFHRISIIHTHPLQICSTYKRKQWEAVSANHGERRTAPQ